MRISSLNSSQLGMKNVCTRLLTSIVVARKAKNSYLSQPVFSPDRRRVMEDQQVKAQVHHHPGHARHALDQEVGAEHHVPHEAVAGEREEDAEVG